MATFAEMLGPAPGSQDPEQVAAQHGLPKGLYSALISVESGGNPNAVSKKGAIGEAQVKQATAKEVGSNPGDLNAGAEYLSRLIKMNGGNIRKALAMYNAGPSGNLSAPGVENYVSKVTGKWKPSFDQMMPPPPPDNSQQSGIAKSPMALNMPKAPAQAPQQQQPNRARELLKGMNWDDMMKNDPGFKAFVNGQTPDASLSASSALLRKMAPKAMQKVDQLSEGAFKAVQNFFFKYADPGTVAGKVFTPGEGAASVAQKFTAHEQAGIARDVARKADTERFLDRNPDYKAVDEQIYQAAEAGQADNLTGAAKYYYENFLKPMRTRNDRMFAQLKQMGVKVFEDVDPKTYMFRQPIQKSESQGIIGKVADAVDPSGALSNAPMTKDLSKSAEMLKQRLAGGAQSQVSGENAAYIIDPAKNEAQVYKNGNVIAAGRVVGDKLVTKQNEIWDLSRSTTAHVEQHTPLRYVKSALSSLTETNRQLNDALSNAHFIEAFKNSPEFRQFARAADENAPQEWRKVDGLPMLQNYRFEPRLAEVLNDWTRHSEGDNVAMLQGMNRIIQGSIFINPIAHIFNVQAHAMIEAGLFGGAKRTIEGAARLVTPGEKTLTRRAVEAVLNHNEDYMRYLKQSPGLKGANTYIKDFNNQLIKELGKNKKELDPVARAMGYATGATLLRGIYTASNKTLWGVGDMILMKAFLAREGEQAGSAMAGKASYVANQVGQHIPTYQIPSRVMGTRSLSQILRQPFLLGFSRYEYNRLASYGSMMRNMALPTVGTRAEAMDQIAALAFHTAVTMPMIDYAVQKATGNPNASFRPFGPFTYPMAVKDYESGKKTASQVAQTVARPSAAMETAKDLYYNQDWRGKPVYGHGGDLTKYLAGKTFETQSLYKIVHPTKGVSSNEAAKQFLLDQVGIRSPTASQVATAKKYANIELKKREKDKP